MYLTNIVQFIIKSLCFFHISSRQLEGVGGGPGVGGWPGPLTLYGYMTRISVLNSAKKGVYFKDFARPRFHENRGIFSISNISFPCSKHFMVVLIIMIYVYSPIVCLL